MLLKVFVQNGERSSVSNATLFPRKVAGGQSRLCAGWGGTAIEALDVVAPAELGTRPEERRRPRGYSEAHRLAQCEATGETENDPCQHAVAGADRALRLDRYRGHAPAPLPPSETTTISARPCVITSRAAFSSPASSRISRPVSSASSRRLGFSKKMPRPACSSATPEVSKTKRLPCRLASSATRA